MASSLAAVLFVLISSGADARTPPDAVSPSSQGVIRCRGNSCLPGRLVAQLQADMEHSPQWRVWVESGKRQSGGWRVWDGTRTCLNCRIWNQEWQASLNRFAQIRDEAEAEAAQANPAEPDPEAHPEWSESIPLYSLPRSSQRDTWDHLCFSAISAVENTIEQIVFAETYHQIATMSDSHIFWTSAKAAFDGGLRSGATMLLEEANGKATESALKTAVSAGFGASSSVYNALKWGGANGALGAFRTSKDLSRVVGGAIGRTGATSRYLKDWRTYAKDVMKVYMGEDLKDEQHYQSFLTTKLQTLDSAIADQNYYCSQPAAPNQVRQNRLKFLGK